MGSPELKLQFKHALAQARRVLQQDLVRYFEANPSVTTQFGKALGLRRLDEGFDSLIWKRHEDKKGWDLLPSVFQTGEGILYQDHNERGDTRILAAAFGMWLYLFDSAQATYYYPFTDVNFVFGSPDSPSVLWPNRKYSEQVSRFLADYRLMIGEGSHGTAARGARTCILPDTFADARGAVALEDLVLRNFAFLAFPLQAEVERSGPDRPGEVTVPAKTGTASDVPFAYLALVFPVPLPSDSTALEKVAGFLEHDFAEAARALFEPVVSHIQDHQISIRQQQLTRALSENSPSESKFIQACGAFANTMLGRPLDSLPQESPVSAHDQPGNLVHRPTDDGGLRDPFAFAGIHWIPPEDVMEADVAAYRVYPKPATLSVMLRGRLEREFDLGAEDPQHDPLGAFQTALNNLLQVEGIKKGPVVVSRIKGEAQGGRRHDLVVLWFARDDKSKGSRNGQALKEAVENVLKAIDLQADERIRHVKRWVGAHWSNDDEGSQPRRPWASFEDAVFERKTYDATTRVVGQILTSLCISTDPARTLARELNGVKQLERLIGARPDLLLGDAGPALSHLAAALDARSTVAHVLAAGVVLRENGGLQDQWRANRAVHNLGKLSSTITNQAVRRVLSLAARYGALMPRASDGLGYRVVRITPWAGDSGDGGEMALLSRSGVARSGVTMDVPKSSPEEQFHRMPFNFSLMTTLSDPWTWVEANEDEDLQREPTAVFDYLYWFPVTKDSFPPTYLLALGPLIAKRQLDALASSADLTCENVVEALGAAPAVCTSWSTEEPARDERLVHWGADSQTLAEWFSKTPRATGGASVKTTRTLLRYCVDERTRISQQQGEDGTPAGFCFPELVFVGGNDAADTSQLHALAERQFRPCRLTAMAQNPLCCPHESEKTVRAVVAEILFSGGMESGTTPEANPGGKGLFHPDWGLRRHLLWPMHTSDRQDAAGLGFFIFSTFVPPLVDSLGESRCPYLLPERHQALLNAAVDYVEFVLSAERAQQNLRKYLGGFSHSLRRRLTFADDLRSLSESAYGICETIEHSPSSRPFTPPSWAPRHTEPPRQVLLGKVATALDSCTSYLPQDTAHNILLTVLLPLWSSHSNYDLQHFRTHALIDALTRTMAGLPEWPLGSMSLNADVGRDGPKLGMCAWARIALESWAGKLPQLYPLINAALAANSEAESITAIPASTVEIVLEEFFRNLVYHGQSGATKDFAFSFSNTGGSLTIEMSNGTPSAAKTPGAGTGQGLRTLNTVLSACAGASGWANGQSDGHLWKTTAYLDLRQYRKRALEHYRNELATDLAFMRQVEEDQR